MKVFRYRSITHQPKPTAARCCSFSDTISALHARTTGRSSMWKNETKLKIHPSCFYLLIRLQPRPHGEPLFPVRVSSFPRVSPHSWLEKATARLLDTWLRKWLDGYFNPLLVKLELHFKTQHHVHHRPDSSSSGPEILCPHQQMSVCSFPAKHQDVEA